MKTNNMGTVALDNLERATGIKAKWMAKPNGETERIELQLKGKYKETFNVEIKKEVRMHQVPAVEDMAAANKPFLLIAENIPPAVKEYLRAKEIAYLDAGGNIFIATKNMYIQAEGNKYIPIVKRGTNRAFTKTGLKAVFHFLLYPEQIKATYQEIAAATGIALGNVKNVLDGLTTAGFTLQLDKKNMKLINTKALFDRWLTGYAEILKPQLLIGKYKLINAEKRMNWQALPLKKNEICWGGEPAAEILTKQLHPEILTVYIADSNHPLITKWKMIPREDGDVEVYQKFWKDDPLFGNETVPPLLIYADLLLTNDPRNFEIAALIKKQYLPDEY